jgi:hypothetical protein
MRAYLTQNLDILRAVILYLRLKAMCIRDAAKNIGSSNSHIRQKISKLFFIYLYQLTMCIYSYIM